MLTLYLHTQRDLLRGSTWRGQRTFPSEYYLINLFIYYVFFCYRIYLFWWNKNMDYEDGRTCSSGSGSSHSGLSKPLTTLQQQQWLLLLPRGNYSTANTWWCCACMSREASRTVIEGTPLRSATWSGYPNDPESRAWTALLRVS